MRANEIRPVVCPTASMEEAGSAFEDHERRATTDRPACSRHALRFAGFAVLLTSLAAGWSCGGSEQATRPTNLLLISIDTLRPDFLGCYGYPRDTSPHLDALAAEGMLFEQASTTAPWTLPAHGSLLTGLYPSRHGATSEDRGISRGVQLLAERLASQGFRTGAIVNSAWLRQRFGFRRGFDDYTLLEPTHDPTRSGEIVDRAIAWLATRARAGEDGTPFFLFMHDLQVHSSYLTLPRFKEGLVGPYDGLVNGTTSQLKLVRSGVLALSDADLQHLSDLYASGIRQADHDLGRLLQALEDTGLAATTLVVVVSDHGEAFMEHGDVLHGRNQFQELMRIPLLFRGPGVPRGRRSAVPVSIVDVMPTVLSLLGGSAPQRSDGADLSELWREGGAPALANRVLFGEADHNNIDLDITRSARRGRHKLHLNRLTGATALYDLAEDPGETRDLKASDPRTSADLGAQLEAFALGAVQGRALPELDPGDEAQLRALGYLDDGPRKRPPVTAPEGPEPSSSRLETVRPDPILDRHFRE